MTKLKLLSAALFTAAVLAAPAVAREHHVSQRNVATDSAAYIAPDAAYAAPAYASNYGCTPAPRVGAFASAPWTNSVPCEPGYVAPQGY